MTVRITLEPRALCWQCGAITSVATARRDDDGVVTDSLCEGCALRMHAAHEHAQIRPREAWPAANESAYVGPPVEPCAGVYGGTCACHPTYPPPVSVHGTPRRAG